MSKLKSIWDAANELRGDLNNTYMFNTGTDTHLLYCASQGIYTCVGRYIAFDDERLVSTVAEFNELVEEMTLGLYVNPVNHGHYLNYVDADKSPLEKDSIVNKPLVYTQEMADNGELPSVGMECMAKRFHESDNGLMISFIIGTNKELDYLVFERDNKLEQHNIANGVWEFSPIDTRTKKEKAIDEIFNNRVWDNSIELLGLAYDEWVGE